MTIKQLKKLMPEASFPSHKEFNITRYHSMYDYGMKEYDVIPWGFEGERMTKKGTPQSAVFAFIKTDKGVSNRRIVMRGPMASKIREITRLSKYTVKLGEFKEGGDMIADNRSVFLDPVRINMSNDKLLESNMFKRN